MAIQNKIGSPVSGEDFYGRAEELAKAHRYLNERQSLLLSAPRRIGKSSFAKRLISDKNTEHWKCVYIDLQGIATHEAFLRKLINSFSGAGILEKAGHRARNFIDSIFSAIDGVELLGLKVDLSHMNRREELYGRFADILDHEQDTLIVIDELPLYLGKLIDNDGHNTSEVEFLLNWFRSLRQHENSKLRWVFCGSVGLRNFTNQYRMSNAINDLVDFELGALNPKEARGLLTELARAYSLNMTDELVSQTLNLMQWPIPYFIQLLVDRLISKEGGRNGARLALENVEEAISELSRSDYFMTWDERLGEYRDLEIMARVILDNLSVAEEGIAKHQLVQILMNGKNPDDEPIVRKNMTKVLEMLEHDGYILRSGELRKFRSPLLGKWWKYKFVD